MNESSKRSKLKLSPLRILLILVVLLSGFYFAQRSGTNPNAYKNDFNVYYFASQEVIAGRTPYENSLGEWTPYLYPPLLAELLSPLVIVPLPVAAYLWFLLNVCALFAALHMATSLTKERQPEPEIDKGFGMKISRQQVIAMATAAVFLRFIFDNFDYGQVNLLVGALSVAHVYFYSKNQKIASLIALVFAVSIKITPAVFLLYHLTKGRVKYVAAGITAMIALTVLSFVPFASHAPEAYNTFMNRTIKNEQGFNFAYHGNQSLRGAIERLQGNQEVTNPASPIALIIGIGCLALACFAAFKSKSEIAAAAPFFCCSVLLSPLSWKQHFVMLLLPVAFLVGESLGEERPKVKTILFATLIVTFALFTLTTPKLLGAAAAQWCDAHSLVFSGALLIFLAITAISLERQRSDHLVG